MRIVALITILLLSELTVTMSKNLKIANSGIKATSSVIKILSNSQATEAFKTIAKLGASLAPFLGVIGPAVAIVAMFLPKGESAEMKLMKEEFAKIDANFDKVFHQFDSLKNVIGKSTMKKQYGRHEMHINHLSNLLRHATKTSSEEKEDEFLYYKDKFMNAYKASYDQAAMALFLGMTENGATLENIPSTIRKSSKNHRGDVQNFMKMVMTLIIQGVKLEIAYARFQNETTESNILTNNWEQKLNKLTNQMRVVDLSVKNAWDETLDKDLDEKLAENFQKDHAEFADELYEFLKKKYDWRDWFVAVYDDVKWGDKHYFTHRKGKAKYKRQDKKRNLIVASTLSTNTKPDKKKILFMLVGQRSEKNAETMFKSAPAALHKLCIKGAVNMDAKPEFRGPADRLVLLPSKNKKYKLFAFN